MRAKKKRPSRIEIDTGSAELVISWDDATQSRFALSDMRKSCPCALCRDQRAAADVAETGELRLLDGEAATATDAASGFVNVGRYGIRISWADGHDTGIYTLDTLREQG
jgi:DUF971 family protein